MEQYNIFLQFQVYRMYIEPSEYLDLTDRITILTKKYELVMNQKQFFSNQLVTSKQTIRMLSNRIAELQAKESTQKFQFKQQLIGKSNDVIQAIKQKESNQKNHIINQISKIKNESALNKLKELQVRINQNQLNSQQKAFCNKVKTLYTIETKKAKCNFNDLFEWVSKKIDESKLNFNDSLCLSNQSRAQKKPRIQKKSLNQSKKDLQNRKKKLNCEKTPNFLSEKNESSPKMYTNLARFNSAQPDILQESKNVENKQN